MGGSGMFKDPAYAPYMHCCDVEEAELGGADFHERAEPHKCFIHRKKGSKGTKPAMVYWHGGGGVAGKASSLHPMMNRVAIESDIVVFNCNYGLAPERVAPLGITDAYAQLC
jgi:acetyl esterase/lipase